VSEQTKEILPKREALGIYGMFWVTESQNHGSSSSGRENQYLRTWESFLLNVSANSGYPIVRVLRHSHQCEAKNEEGVYHALCGTGMEGFIYLRAI